MEALEPNSIQISNTDAAVPMGHALHSAIAGAVTEVSASSENTSSLALRILVPLQCMKALHQCWKGG